MQRIVRLIWDRLQTTIWFIPTLLALGGVLAALKLIDVDLKIDPDGKSWMTFFQIGTAGVRQVLAVTTGAMMTITGVVFSISVVTLTLAANQFGAKILRNYLSDWRNKLVLGLFVGSFLYGLIVLASIDSDASARIPALAFMVSLLLTVVAIAALIYFIHNISTSIQADVLIAEIGKSLSDTVARTVPSRDSALDPALLRNKWEIAVHGDLGTPVYADHSGYVEYIDYDALLNLSHPGQYTLEITIRAGNFVVKGNPVATLYSRERTGIPAAEHINRQIAIGPQRTNVQDLEYGITQLLQIAQRALSPGINDSLTGIACIDWLSAALAAMAVRHFEPEYRTDAEGVVRMKIHAFDFEGAVNAVFHPLRQNTRDNEMVAIRLLDAIAAVMQVCGKESYLRVLRRHADLINRSAESHFQTQEDIDATGCRYAACVAVFEARLEALRSPPTEAQQGASGGSNVNLQDFVPR